MLTNIYLTAALLFRVTLACQEPCSKSGMDKITDLIILFDNNGDSLDEDVFEKQRSFVVKTISDSFPPENRGKTLSFVVDARYLMTRELEWDNGEPFAVTGEALDKALAMLARIGSSQRRQVILVITTMNPKCAECTANESTIGSVSVVTMAIHTHLGGLGADGFALLQCLDGFSAKKIVTHVKAALNADTCPVQELVRNDCAQKPTSGVPLCNRKSHFPLVFILIMLSVFTGFDLSPILGCICLAYFPFSNSTFSSLAPLPLVPLPFDDDAFVVAICCFYWWAFCRLASQSNVMSLSLWFTCASTVLVIYFAPVPTPRLPFETAMYLFSVALLSGDAFNTVGVFTALFGGESHYPFVLQFFPLFCNTLPFLGVVISVWSEGAQICCSNSLNLAMCSGILVVVLAVAKPMGRPRPRLRRGPREPLTSIA